MKVLATIAVIASVAGLGYTANEALKMPDVHFSYSSGECVKVVNYTDEQFTCGNYPKKFNHVWVQ